MLPCADRWRSASHAGSCMLPSTVRQCGSRDLTFHRVDPYGCSLSHCLSVFAGLRTDRPLCSQLPDLKHICVLARLQQARDTIRIDLMVLSCVSEAVGIDRTQTCVRKDGQCGLV
jgi:hypothetical protein